MLHALRKIEVNANTVAERLLDPSDDGADTYADETAQLILGISQSVSKFITELESLGDHFSSEELIRDDNVMRTMRLSLCLPPSSNRMIEQIVSASARRAEIAASKDKLREFYMESVVNAYTVSRVAQRLGEMFRLLKAEGKFDEK